MKKEDFEILYQIKYEVERAERLIEFVKESLAIENIPRPPTNNEIDEAERFLSLDKLTIDELEKFIKVYQSNAILRYKSGLNVRVGDYKPPAGSHFIRLRLEEILEDYNNFDGNINDLDYENFILHSKYEALHPFTDCNGRSGRMLYLWFYFKHMKKLPKISFLHMYYYQSLNFYRAVNENN